MKTMVRWTGREWALLAQYFLDLEIDPEKYGFSRSLDNAQKALLPKERWRSIKGVPATLKKELKEHITALEYKVAFDTPYPPPEDKPPSAESLSTEELLVEIARRIAKLLEPAKPNPVDRAFFPPLTKAVTEACKIEKARILIVGPRAEQREALRTKFPMLCLRFVDVESGERAIREMATTCVEIILWTRFMTHSQQETAKNTRVRTWYANTLQQIEGRLQTWATT